MRYLVKVARGERFVTELALEAASAEAAREEAIAQGLAVIGVTNAGGLRAAIAERIRARERFDVLVFAVELAALLKAGLNAGEAVRALAGSYATSAHGATLERIHRALAIGQPLSGAIETAFPGVAPLFIATLKAAERTSDLESALSRYIAYATRIEALRRQVVSVLIYPAILVAVGLAVSAFLLLYVVPRFAGIYEEVSGDIPFYSALLLTAGRWISQHGALTAAIVLALLAVCVAMCAHPATRARVLGGLWFPAVVRSRITAFHLARLYRSLGMLLRSGIPFIDALAMSAALLPARLRAAAQDARERLREGRSIANALSAAGLTTAMAAQMLAVGSRTGDMGTMLDRIADFHDEALSRWLDTAMRVFEPALMTAIGIVIGGIVVLMYMPIFELAGGLN